MVHQSAGIGVSAPGPLNPITGCVVAPPNLKGWHNVPLGDILHENLMFRFMSAMMPMSPHLAETVMGAARGCPPCHLYHGEYGHWQWHDL